MRSKARKVFWSESEYLLLAKALVERFPFRNYQDATTIEQLDFAPDDVDSAMRRVLPKARQRNGIVTKMTAIKPHLLTAMQKIKADPTLTFARGESGEPAPAPTDRIVWTANEWKVFALAVHVLNPAIDFLSKPEAIDHLNCTMANAATNALPATRRRNFPHVQTARRKLAEIYEEARTTRDPLFYSASTEPVAPEVAAAVEADAKCSRRVFWSRGEWQTVAGEIHRLYPHCRYPDHPDRLTGLTSADVAYAQRALPEARRRPNLKGVSMTVITPHLSRGFGDLALALADEAAQAREAAEKPTPAPAVAAPPPAPENEWEAALKPLMSLVVKNLTDSLRPMIVDLVRSTIFEAVGAPTPSPAAAPVEAAPKEPEAAAPRSKVQLGAPEQPPRTYRPKIGVLSGRNTYNDDLVRAFPDLDFVCIDTAKKVDSFKNCDRVIALTKFISHSADRACKKIARDRYVRLDGSVSDMKRVIAGWMADNILQANQ